MPPLHAVVVADGEPPVAVTLEGVGSDDRIADLLRAFRRPADARVRIDDTDAPFDARIVDVAVRGVEMKLGSPALGAATRSEPSLASSCSSSSTSSAALAGVVWCSGPDSGRRADLTPGRHVVGRNASGALRTSDPAMAPHHALIEVGPNGDLELSDLGVGRPVELDGRAVSARCRLTLGSRIGVGASVLEVVAPQDRSPRRGRPTPARARAPGGWTVPYHRPPRSRPVVGGEPIAAPLPASDAHGGVGIVGVISLVVSLLGGLALALVLRQPLLFLMVGLGAVGGVVTWVVQWVQAGRGRRARRRLRSDQLAEFEACVQARWAAAAAAAADYPTLSGTIDAAAEATEIWARRPVHGDAYVISLGTGDAPWEPPVARTAGVTDPEVAAVIERFSQLPGVASTMDLGAAGAIGVAGDPTAARSLVRSMIVQLGVTTGPADWELLVVAPPDRFDDWTWTAWLPHSCVDGAGDPITYDEVEARVGSLVRGSGERERRLIVVVDGAAPLAARTSPLRRLAAALRESMTLVVLTAERSQLPAMCEVVVEVAATGDVVVLEPGVVPRRAEMAGCSAEVACSSATRLARWRDPELHVAGADLDRSVELVDLVGAQAFDADAIAASWRRGGRDPRPIATLGRAADGIVEIDLVADGPHALVAGTTGAGKSELLRTLVTALALGSSPAALSFVLIDYKGGSAFDACAGLPHVAGIVTDLDDRLAARVLRSLDAELRRRERLLRAANAADLTVYRANPANRQIPRLVIVVDEFAALAAELPEFLSTLVNVAQRGRSLGIHLVLATQRPSGVLSDDIRANTNLRIALRVQDDADAVDVVGQTGPARFARHAPGRAALRLGTEEVLVFQTARCTSPVRSLSDDARTPLIVRAGGPGRARRAAPQSVDPANGAGGGGGGGGRGGGRTMLDQLVQAAVVAAAVIVAENGVAEEAQRPWLSPLPAVVALPTLPLGMVGLLDDPDRQEQCAHRWAPTDGHLVLAGTLGSGTTTALTTVAHALTAGCPPSALHLYALDAGAGAAERGLVGDLCRLPHVGAVVGVAEGIRRRRLLHRLDRILDDRAAGAPPAPTIVLLVDGFTSLRSTLLDAADGDELAWLDRLVHDGPRHGVVAAATIDQPSAAPASLLARTAERWVFRLADPIDASLLGVAPGTALGTGTPPGRCIVSTTGLEMQVAIRSRDADHDDGTDDGGNDHDGGTDQDGRPDPIQERPPVLGIADIGARPERSVDGLWLPVGLADASAAPVGLRLHPGEHVFVGGAPRSGRTNALATIAAQWRIATPGGWVGLITPRPALRLAGAPPGAAASAGGTVGDADDVLAAFQQLDPDRSALLVVDDADLVQDDQGALAGLLAAGRPHLFVIAAGRPDVVRSTYGHWTAAVRRSRKGLLLGAVHDLDGDVLGVLLPRRGTNKPRPGDGLLVADGTVTPMQLAMPCG